MAFPSSRPASARPSPATLRAVLAIRGLKGLVGGPFDLTVEPAHCTLISGPSGIGKSLLLRMIADLDPSTGSVALGGRSRDAMPGPAWRRMVTYVAAESGWWADLVRDHVEQPDAARAMLPSLGLDPSLLDAPVARLSTGERQRLALVRAILLRPSVLLLDEPTAALDPETTGRVEALLLGLKREGMGLLVVSHDASQAVRIADQHLTMSRSGLRPVGP